MIGMALHGCVNALDNAGGQLARLTARQTRYGRIVDGYVDHLIWISIYLHLILRFLMGGMSPAVCFLGIAAALSHGLQSAAADYFRNSYLHFVKGRSRANLDSSSTLREDC